MMLVIKQRSFKPFASQKDHFSNRGQQVYGVLASMELRKMAHEMTAEQKKMITNWQWAAITSARNI